MTLVEKMAKAMYESHEFVRPWEHPEAQRIHGKYLRTSAIAALKAIRDPSASMLAAAAMSAVEDDMPYQEGLGAVLERLPPTGHPDGPAILADIRRDYRAMIDQAIKEGEDGR